MKSSAILLPVARCHGWDQTESGIPAEHEPHVFKSATEKILTFCHGEGGFE